MSVTEEDDEEKYEAYMREEWAKIRDEFSGNPLKGCVVRVYFVSKKNRRRWREIELLGYCGRFYTVTDAPRGRLDRLAEELIPQEMVPPNITPYQCFLDYFRQLEGKKQKRG